MLILSDKISENIRNKSYESITHSAVKPKKTNYEYMQSMNYTVYNGWERVWTFKSGLYFAIIIDSKIVSEDASLAKPTMLKLSRDKGWLVMRQRMISHEAKDD